MWALHPQFRPLVLKAWNFGIFRNKLKLYNNVSKLKLVKRVLRALNREHFGAIVEKADTVQAHLLHIQTQL